MLDVHNVDPKVSVVTPVYNGEDFFDRAVPSILGQTYENFEFVIVDDGSTDRTPQLLSSLAEKDARVRVLSPGRLGFVKALNYGIERARGIYIARQDFDDRSFPERLECQVDFLDSHPSVGVVGGYYIRVDENRDERFVRLTPLEHTEIVRAMAKRIPFAHTVVMFRKEAWRQAGGYPEVEDIEDLRLWVSIASLGWKLANLDSIMGEHYVHADSFWHRNFRYRERQRSLRVAQLQAIHRLDLPPWMAIYPLGRVVYSFLPSAMKRMVRRSFGSSRERDV